MSTKPEPENPRKSPEPVKRPALLGMPLSHLLRWKWVALDYTSKNDFLVINDPEILQHMTILILPPYQWVPDRPRLIVEDLGPIGTQRP